jgi:hypothetical protein
LFAGEFYTRKILRWRILRKENSSLGRFFQPRIIRSEELSKAKNNPAKNVPSEEFSGYMSSGQINLRANIKELLNMAIPYSECFF